MVDARRGSVSTDVNDSNDPNDSDDPNDRHSLNASGTPTLIVEDDWHTDLSRVRFFQRVAPGGASPRRAAGATSAIRREGAPSTAWGNPATGPGHLDSKTPAVQQRLLIDGSAIYEGRSTRKKKQQ
jgi:hypothetical protein